MQQIVFSRICFGAWALMLALALAGCGEDAAVAAGNSTTDTATTSDVPVGGDGSTGGGNKPCVTSADCLPVVEPCRAASCQPNVGCVTVILSDGAVCDDGNACTQGEV
ncbi:MAG: hypothetical protein HY902_02005, partial [Deltaproteobacteria bacterium]|nr:hypothetical protein [Deltaproteobacteria bacterium]